MYTAFLIFICECAVGITVALGISVSEIGLGGKDSLYAALFQTGEQIVYKIEMLVFEEMPLAVADLDVPEMKTESVKAETRHVIDIAVDGGAAVYAERAECAVCVSERHGIVGAVVRTAVKSHGSESAHETE